MYDTFDSTITIFNKRYDREAGRDVWKRTVIHGASWYGKQAASVGDNGLNSASLYTVRIPIESMPEGYMTPDEFNATEGPASGWTAQTEDIVVKGEVLTDIAAPKDVTQKHAECFTVLAVRDNRRGPFGQHLRIEGA